MSDDTPEQTASQAENQAASLAHDTKISDLTISQLTAIMRSETERAVAAHLGRLAGAATATHVNSGPPGFVNGGGHANFDPRSVLSANRGGLAGVHVNSGPPGFINGGGHANFDPGSHVNSGPPGFVNGGGHANFDPKTGAQAANPVINVTLASGQRLALPASGPINMRIGGVHIAR